MSFTCVIKVVPLSGRTAAILDKNKVLKCYLKSPPENGKANKELIQYLAKALKIPQMSVTLVSGATGRTKLVRINTGHTYEQLLDALEVPRQLGVIE